MRRILALSVAAVLVFAGSLGAQVLPQPEIGSRLIDLPSHRTVGYGVIEAAFIHRFSQTVDDGGGKNLWGLDSAADVGLGLAFGFSPRMQVELYRSSFLKEWEGAFKWTLARQGGDVPLGLAVRLGGAYRSADGIDDRWTGFVQAVLARRVGDRLDLFLVPGWVSDTPTLTDAANVGAAAALHLPKRWDLMLEVMPPNGDAEGAEVSWSIGFNKRIRGHSFLIYLGNSRATTTDLLYGTDIPGGYGAGDVRLGFNIVRRFPE